MKIIQPIATEKTVKLIELENVLVFEVDRRIKKTEIKKEIEEMFNVKVEKVRVVIRHNKKYVYISKNSRTQERRPFLGWTQCSIL